MKSTVESPELEQSMQHGAPHIL